MTSALLDILLMTRQTGSYLGLGLEELLQGLSTHYLNPYVHLLHWCKGSSLGFVMIFNFLFDSTLNLIVHKHDLIIRTVLDTLLSIVHNTMHFGTRNGQLLLLSLKVLHLHTYLPSSLLQHLLLPSFNDSVELLEGSLEFVGN